MKTVFFFFCILAGSFFCPLFGQAGLEVQSDFFDTSADGYASWLNSAGLGSFFTVDGVETEPDMAILFLSSKVENLDTLSVLWQDAKDIYGQGDNNRLAEHLFRQWVFTAETGADSLMLIIEDDNPYFTVEVKSLGGNIQIFEDVPPAMTKGTSKILLDEGFGGMVDKRIVLTPSKELAGIRKQLVAHFQDYFTDSKKGTLLQSARFEVLENVDDRVVFEVQNISREILYDLGYFELLEIHFYLNEGEDDDIVLQYEVYGKYGRGLLIAPRRGDYRLMISKYPDYVQRYEKILATRIREVLE